MIRDTELPAPDDEVCLSAEGKRAAASQENSTPIAGTEPARFLPWLLLLFAGSGCAALIYEIVWLQLLQLVIGLTTISLGLLLGIFMGGLCLGSLLLPRLISAQRHPLRVYALLELGIGIIGIAVLFMMPLVAETYTTGGWHGLVVRGAVAAVCLLPPTLLMGATLPAMSRWIETTPKGVSWLGFFYGGNIAGAVAGCLLAGFYLLRVHDMATATYVAATINGAVALIALVLAFKTTHRSQETCSPGIGRREESPASESEIQNPKPGTDPGLSENVSSPGVAATLAPADGVRRAPAFRAVYVTIALSGLAALGAEVVWTRLLSLMLGATVYTFSIILAVFLAGLGFGSNIGSFLSRSMVQPRIALGYCQIFLCAASAWAAYAISHSLPYWPINPSVSLSPWYTFQLDLARCLWAILPAAILWGASFPLALAAVALRGQDPGRLVGGVYAANTVGAIIGALGFSLLVIPLLGTQWAQRLIIGMSGISALVMFAPSLRPLRPKVLEPVNSRREEALLSRSKSETRDARSNQSPITPAATASRAKLTVAIRMAASMALVSLLAWSVSPTPWGLTAFGRFLATYGKRLAPGIRDEKDVPQDGGRPDIYATYVGEGLNGSVAVTRWTSGERNFHSAGKVQASTGPADMRLQRLLGHISALAHSKPESVLVVACGAGVTAGTFVLHPDVKRIVVCDIEPLVPKFVAPMFEKENYGVVRDPRTEVVLDDGRHFIRTTREKFDIITSDPVDPWVKGCAALSTVEYYEMCRAHLRPGGVMTMWIPLYESNSETVKSSMATFFKVFPNGILWSNDHNGEGYDAVLLGRAGPAQLDLDALCERFDRDDHARVKQSLQEVGFHTAISLLGTYAGQAPDLQEWTRNAQINTDRNLRLQYLAGMSLNSYMGSEILAEIRASCQFPERLFVGSETRKEMVKLLIERSKSNE
jgi:spermidine synthase